MGSNKTVSIITGVEVEIIMRDGSAYDISSPRMPSTDGSWMTVIDTRYGREVIRYFNLNEVQHYSLEKIIEEQGELSEPIGPIALNKTSKFS